MQKQQAHNDNGVATLTQHYPDANATQTQCKHSLLSMKQNRKFSLTTTVRKHFYANKNMLPPPVHATNTLSPSDIAPTEVRIRSFSRRRLVA